jgi:hypothetical protein
MHSASSACSSSGTTKHPRRISRLALIDTLVSVWIPWGIHGYWFKCEPEAEAFWKQHHRPFIRSIFAGEPAPYAGPPESPWAAVEGTEVPSQVDPRLHWNADDVAHYEEKFANPDVWFHAVQYYRHALPFHIERADPSAPRGVSYEFLSSARVASMWKHPELLFGHPDFRHFMVFAPEDRHLRFEGPTLYLFSPFLVPQAFEDGPPPDDYIPAGNPYADSFAHHFPDLRARGATCGHFIPEEAPDRTSEVLGAFLSGEI